MDLWKRIQTKWREDGLQPPPGVDIEQIDAFEQRCDVILPPAMRSFYQTVNGSGDMGSDVFTFWSLDKVKLVSAELTDIHSDRYDYPDCYIFADYLLWCWAYAIRLGPNGETDGPVYLVGGKKPLVVAQSFLDFMQRYASDPNNLI